MKKEDKRKARAQRDLFSRREYEANSLVLFFCADNCAVKVDVEHFSKIMQHYINMMNELSFIHKVDFKLAKKEEQKRRRQ